jgi:hypothetical protein
MINLGGVMKQLLTIMIVLSLVGSVCAVDITITIPNNKVDRVLAAFLYYHPKPFSYTNKEWFKEVWRQQIIEEVHAYETQQNVQEAINTTVKDESVVD